MTDELSVRFGAVLAVDRVSIDCRAGELTGLIGPNGAGKTTLIDAITGFVSSKGSVRFDGADVTGWAPHRIAQAGLRRTWQSQELFDDITVRANLRVACGGTSVRHIAGDLVAPRAAESSIESTLEALGIATFGDYMPTDLPQGQRKLLGLARALVAKPKLLLLDEPAAGLDRSETRWLGALLRRLVGAGQSMLLIDHDMSLVLTACDRIHVLQSGQVIASGDPAAIRVSEDVLAAYLGTRRPTA
jgi:branched-chain amino acid transport system ATP-binding protein